MAKIAILDSTGQSCGYIKQKFKFLKPSFQLCNVEAKPIAMIEGDWKAWKFTILDTNGNIIGSIDKKWAGLTKELFTTADKYRVNIIPELADDQNKITIAAAAITLDMILKSNR